MLKDSLPQWGAGRKIGPSLVLTEEHLQRCVDHLMKQGVFVIDVETTFAPHPSVNDVLWVGLGSYGCTYLIPMRHPNGSLVKAGTYDMVPDMSTVRPYANNPHRFTKPKLVREDVPAVYTPAPKQLRPDVVFKILEPLLFSDLVKVGHNLKFDLMSISKYYGGREIPGPHADTIIMAHLLDEHKPEYTLKALVTRRYLGLKAQNPAIREAFYPNLGKAGVEEFSIEATGMYLAKDVTYTFLFWKFMAKQMHEQGFKEALLMDMEVYPAIIAMEQRGILVDQTTLVEEHAKVLKESADVRMDVWRICGEQFPLTSTAKKIHYLFGHKDQGGQGLKPTKFTEKTHQPQVDKKALAAFVGNPLVDLLLRFSELDKQRQFCEQLSVENTINGRIHASFNQHRTDTGRLSSSQPNLQQVPRGETFRKVFIPKAGYVFIVADYDQIELRVIAYLSGDENMIETFCSGADIHSAVAAMVLGIAIEDVTPELRQIGKGINFLVGFGGTGARLADLTGLPVNECDAHVDNYYRRYPAINPWKVRVIAAAVKTGDRSDPSRFPPMARIEPFGRVRRLPDLYSSVPRFSAQARRQAVNTTVQGFAAYVMKMALVRIHSALRELDSDAGIVLNVHDEVIVECREADAERVKNIVEVGTQGIMLDGKPILGSVPLVASAHVGYSWYEGKG